MRLSCRITKMISDVPALYWTNFWWTFTTARKTFQLTITPLRERAREGPGSRSWIYTRKARKSGFGGYFQLWISFVFPDLNELHTIIGCLQEHIGRTGSVLVRQLKRRDALRRQQQSTCDVISRMLYERKYRQKSISMQPQLFWFKTKETWLFTTAEQKEMENVSGRIFLNGQSPSYAPSISIFQFACWKESPYNWLVLVEFSTWLWKDCYVRYALIQFVFCNVTVQTMF